MIGEGRGNQKAKSKIGAGPPTNDKCNMENEK
jgi:hypothetical protein